MKKGVLKVTACCLAGAITFAGNGGVSLAAGFEVPLAGGSAKIAEQESKAQSAQPETSAPSEFDTTAIAQVDEYVNIRDHASTDEGEVLGKLYNNSAAKILAKEGDWYLISSGSVTGYVKSDYFVTGQAAEELAKEVGQQKATVKTTTLMVRSDSNQDSEVLAMVGDSQQLNVVEDNGDWVKVTVDDDVEGYVAKDYVECETVFTEAESIEEEQARLKKQEEDYRKALEEARRADEAARAEQQAQNNNETGWTEAPTTEAPSTEAPTEAPVWTEAPTESTDWTEAPTEEPVWTEEQTDAPSTNTGLREQIVGFALQFVGGNYVWGGTDLYSGVDCSGFTQQVLGNFGISIPRTAGAQSVSGPQISMSEMQPGDLLFYSGDGDYGIGHVSMYIGNGQVVHASTPSTGIIISDVNYRQPTCIVNYIG